LLQLKILFLDVLSLLLFLLLNNWVVFFLW